MSDSVLGPVCPYCEHPITSYDRVERLQGALWHEQCAIDFHEARYEQEQFYEAEQR